MSEANKAVALKFIEALGKGDAETAKTVMTEDVVAIAKGTSIGSGSRDYAEIVAIFGMFGQITNSGLNPTILSVTAEGDRVDVEWESRCTAIASLVVEQCDWVKWEPKRGSRSAFY